jgi:hypothetical protein
MILKADYRQPVTDSLASLRSSILQHQIENGRTYHSMSAGSKSKHGKWRDID